MRKVPPDSSWRTINEGVDKQNPHYNYVEGSWVTAKDPQTELLIHEGC